MYVKEFQNSLHTLARVTRTINFLLNYFVAHLLTVLVFLFFYFILFYFFPFCDLGINYKANVCNMQVNYFQLLLNFAF
jgi:hypothetical protein